MGCHRSSNDDMVVGYSIGMLHKGFHGMVTIPDNIPEVPEVPGLQESAYKGLESMSEPRKLREWYVGRSDCDIILQQTIQFFTQMEHNTLP